MPNLKKHTLILDFIHVTKAWNKHVHESHIQDFRTKKKNARNTRYDQPNLWQSFRAYIYKIIN